MASFLFPDVPRDFPFRRAVRTALRALHLLTTGVLLGGHVFGQPRDQLIGWLWGSIISGALLLATDLHASFAVLCQVRGLLMAPKLVLVALVYFFWEARVPLLIAALVIGAVGSHMPGSLRYHLLFLRGRVARDERSG